MRLFVAIELTAGVRASLETLIGELRPKVPGVKWVRASNLHLTLKFLGETPNDKLSEVIKALEAVRSEEAVHVDVRGTGFFPNAKRGRVFWAGVEASANLVRLAGAVDEAMGSVGFPREEHGYTPHLTLARSGRVPFPAALAEESGKNARREFGTIMAREFRLIESRLKAGGAEYTTVQQFQFATEF